MVSTASAYSAAEGKSTCTGTAAATRYRRCKWCSWAEARRKGKISFWPAFWAHLALWTPITSFPRQWPSYAICWTQGRLCTDMSVWVLCPFIGICFPFLPVSNLSGRPCWKTPVPGHSRAQGWSVRAICKLLGLKCRPEKLPDFFSYWSWFMLVLWWVYNFAFHLQRREIFSGAQLSYSSSSQWSWLAILA